MLVLLLVQSIRSADFADSDDSADDDEVNLVQTSMNFRYAFLAMPTLDKVEVDTRNENFTIHKLFYDIITMTMYTQNVAKCAIINSCFDVVNETAYERRRRRRRWLDTSKSTNIN